MGNIAEPLRPRVAEAITLRLSVEGEGWGARIKQQIRQWGAAGLDETAILAKLQEELSSGGTLFEGIMRQFQNVTGEAVDYVSIEQVHDAWTGTDSWTWISVRDKSRCDDCRDRHGQTMSWAEWEAQGLPGTGATVCTWRCRCSLEPKETVGDIALGTILTA